MTTEPLTTPTWQDGVKLREYPTLENDETADVVVVGGGMTGLLAAYMLAEAGKSVIVLEANRVARGVTAYTTAFLTQYVDADTSELVSVYGKDEAREIWNSHGAAIGLIEQLVGDYHIDCEFMRCAYYLFAKGKSQRKDLQQEYEAMSELGLPVILHDKPQLGFRNNGAVTIPSQAKFHPLKFLSGLLPVLEQKGVRIYEQTPVVGIHSHGVIHVLTERQRNVEAETFILTTYNPLDMKEELFLKKGMYTTYVFEAQVPRDQFPEGLFQDMANPYHYFRIDKMPGYERMIIGGEDNRQELTFHEGKNFNALRDYAGSIVGGKQFTIARQWSGPILEPSDGLALIGEVRPYQFVATAFSGNGMTYSGVSALLIRDLLTQRHNNWEDLYDPMRRLSAKTLAHKGLDYTEEFINAALSNALHHR